MKKFLRHWFEAGAVVSIAMYLSAYGLAGDSQLHGLAVKSNAVHVMREFSDLYPARAANSRGNDVRKSRRDSLENSRAVCRANHLCRISSAAIQHIYCPSDGAALRGPLSSTLEYGVETALVFNRFQAAVQSSGGNSCAAGLLLTVNGACNVHPTAAGHQLIASIIAEMVPPR
jgi:hypothetical protein